MTFDPLTFWMSPIHRPSRLNKEKSACEQEALRYSFRKKVQSERHWKFDRPKSVRNRCVIELLCGVVSVVTLPFWHFCWCRRFCHITESDLFLFLFNRFDSMINMGLSSTSHVSKWSKNSYHWKHLVSLHLQKFPFASHHDFDLRTISPFIFCESSFRDIDIFQAKMRLMNNSTWYSYVGRKQHPQ